MYSRHCPNYSTTFQADWNHHVPMNRSRVRLKNTYDCRFCLKNYLAYMRYENKEGLTVEFQSRHRILKWTLSLKTSMTQTQKEPIACKNFPVDFELEKLRLSVINFALSAFNNSFTYEKLDHVVQLTQMCSQSQTCNRVCCKNVEERRCRYFFCTRKQYGYRKV